jgi:PAS domain S-box-containing protein
VNSTLEPLVGTWLIRRLIDTPYPFERTKDLGLFAGVAALFAPTISATLGTLGACSLGFVSWEDFLTVWLTWWAGDAVGTLIIAPFILTWFQPPREPISLKQWAKGTPLFILLAGIIWLGLENTPGTIGLAPYYLGYLVIPLTIAVTFQFGQRGATLATLITTVIAVWRILGGHGPFSANPQQAALLLQSYLAVLNITALMLAAVLTEREHVKEAARGSTAQLELAVHAIQMGTWSWNIPNGTIQWSEEIEASLGAVPGGPQETREAYYKRIHPDDRERVAEALAHFVKQGRDECQIEHRILTPDGKVRWIEVRGKLLKDPQGQPLQFTGTVIDITQRKEAETALRLTQFAVEQSPEAVFLINPDATFADVNRAACHTLGYSREELLTMGVPDIDPNFSAEIWPAHWAEVKERKTFSFESLHRTKTGRQFPVEITVNYLEFEGQPYNWTFARDITESKLAEDALRRSERLFHSLLESLPQNVYSKDLEGRFIFANQNYCHIQGKPLEEIVGKSDFDLHPPELAQKYRDDDLAVIQGGQTVEIIEEHQPLGKEKFYVDVIKTPVYSAKSEITGTLGIFWDITDRKRTEEAMANLLAQVQEQAQRVQQIIDTVPEGVLLLNPEQEIISTNPIAERELLILDTTLSGQRLTHLGLTPLNALLTSPPKGLWHEVKSNGQTFEVIARPIETGPTTGGWVLILRDVTKEREIQEQVRQQERLVAVGQLAAGIAHDFNNIMAVVVLYAQLMAQTPDLPHKFYERLGTIQSQAQQATNLIQQILDFSRRAVLERKPMDLRPFLKEVAGLLKRTLPENIKVALSYSDEEYTIHADSTRMQQMIMNLAVNARDAMPDGGTFSLALGRAGDAIRLAVADTGTGISPEALSHVFEPFFTTKAPGQGTGLGLAQVYGIVKQHDGEIQVKSQMGMGTTFIITFPSYSTALRPLPEEPHSLTAGSGELILVVEDNMATQEALTASLEMLGYHVLTAGNGQEALSVIREHGVRAGQDHGGIALVLSDVVMPDMGGIALFHALRKEAVPVKFVLLTGHPLKEELETLRAQGLAGWLSKPPNLDALADMVARALKG